MTKVDITDSSPVFTRGLAGVLADAGFDVIEVRNVSTGSFSWRADVLLVDPDAMASLTLDEFIDSAKRTAPVLVLGHAADEDLARYLVAGAAGFVDRRSHVPDLLAAVRQVANGGGRWPVAPEAAHDRQPTTDNVTLSPRECQVLRQIARGLTHGQVARRLGISHHTVDTYVKRIRSKLQVGNKAELTRAAVLGPFDREARLVGSGPDYRRAA